MHKIFHNFDSDPKEPSEVLKVHYRLGDLLTITEKTFAPNGVIRCILEAKRPIR
jgi:hypothetical protein